MPTAEIHYIFKNIFLKICISLKTIYHFKINKQTNKPTKQIPGTSLVELVNLWLETSLAVLMTDQQTGNLLTRSKMKNNTGVIVIPMQ